MVRSIVLAMSLWPFRLWCCDLLGQSQQDKAAEDTGAHAWVWNGLEPVPGDLRLHQGLHAPGPQPSSNIPKVGEVKRCWHQLYAHGSSDGWWLADPVPGAAVEPGLAWGLGFSGTREKPTSAHQVEDPTLATIFPVWPRYRQRRGGTVCSRSIFLAFIGLIKKTF